MSTLTNTGTIYVDIDERLTTYAVKTPPTEFYIVTENKIIALSEPETSMECYYRTKTLDFTDQFPELINVWTAIDRIDITYHDIDASTPLSVHLSNDAGATWTSKHTTIGTGNGKVKIESFTFKDTEYACGKFFVIKIESTSSNKNFEIIEIRIHIIPLGEYFAVS
jgi:hypothetical protein